MVEQQFLRAHHVENRDEGEIDAVSATRDGIERRGTGGSLASAQDIRADDKKAAGVDGLAGTNEVVPPAWFSIRGGVPASAVVIAAQRVENDDRVVARGIECPVGFVTQRKSRNTLPALERERLRVNKVTGRHETDLPGREVACGFRRGRELDVVGHASVEGTSGRRARQGLARTMTFCGAEDRPGTSGPSKRTLNRFVILSAAKNPRFRT